MNVGQAGDSVDDLVTPYSFFRASFFVRDFG
jgi:hypothetical protein